MHALTGFILVLFLLVSGYSGLSQGNPATGVQDGKTNFYQIQKQFNDQWKDRPVTKGSGYKVFRRWEWYWEQRVGLSGEFPSNDIVLREWEKYAASNMTDNPMDSVANWTQMGPTIPSGGYVGLGRINCIAFHPTDKNTFWVGTPSGGIWKTTDFGDSWMTFINKMPVLGVSDIVIDPNNPQVMYIATGDGDGGSLSAYNGTDDGDNKSVGVLKSVNGGLSWDSTGLKWNPDQNHLIRGLVMHPTNSGILLAATTNGIYKTTNGGVTFLRKKDGCFMDICYNTGNPMILYAATKFTISGTPPQNNYAQIFRSTNGGDNWDQVTTFDSLIRIKLTVSKTNSQLVEALGTNEAGGLHSVKRSVDGGLSFFTLFYLKSDNSNNYLNSDFQGKIKSNSGQGSYDLCYLIDPQKVTDRWLGGVNTYKSTNNGLSFNMVTYWCDTAVVNPNFKVVHADKHWFTFHPLETGTFFEGNDGGISYTKDGGINWKDISKGLQIGQIYKIGDSYSNQNIIAAGFQDNGSQVYRNGIWTAPVSVGGDGMGCIVDYVDPKYIYTSYCNGVIYRTSDPTLTNWVTISDSIKADPKATGAWVTPFVMHPTDPKVLYAGYKGFIYKTSNQGDSWRALSPFPSAVPKKDSTIRTLAIAEDRPKNMYASTGYKMFGTRDEWAHSRVVLLPDTTAQITGIAVHNSKPDTVYITYSGYKNGIKVYRTYNGGTTWVNISESLPNVPVNCIVYHEIGDDGLYIGTDLGVYFRNSKINKWIYFNNGLPNVVVTDLKIQLKSGKIRAATFGRGLWESLLYTAKGSFQVNNLEYPPAGGESTGGGVYQPGQVAKLLAVAEPGWKFDGWYENDLKVSDSLDYEFTVESNHNLEAMFDEPSGISDNKLKTQIHISPNPTTGIVKISLDESLKDELQKVIVTTLEGKTFLETSPRKTGDQYTVDLSSAPQGSYILSFYFKSGGKVSYKVTVRK